MIRVTMHGPPFFKDRLAHGCCMTCYAMVEANVIDCATHFHVLGVRRCLHLHTVECPDCGCPVMMFPREETGTPGKADPQLERLKATREKNRNARRKGSTEKSEQA